MSRRAWYRVYPDEKLDDVKKQICEFLSHEMLYEQLDQKGMARKLGTSQANVSRVQNLRVEDLTFNQLFKYAAVLCPHFRMLLAKR